MKFNPLLKHLGIGEKEECVYRALLALGDASVSDIAKRSNMKRTSTYYVLEELSKMGLVSSYRERGVIRYFAEHPSRLKSYFEERAILAERAIPLLQKESAPHRGGTSVRLFEGAEGIKTISEMVLEAKDTTVLSIGSSKKLLEITGGTFGYGTRRRARKIFSRALRSKEDNIKNETSRFHDIRILPETFLFPGYIIIFKHSVGIIPFEEPPRGIVIEDPSCALMMQTLFEELWKNGEKPK